MYVYGLSFDGETRLLSDVSGKPFLSTSGDVGGVSVSVSIPDMFADWTAEAVFSVPMDGPGGRYLPSVQLSGMGERSAGIPPAVLRAARNSLMPIRLKLTHGDDVLYSGNAVDVNVPILALADEGEAPIYESRSCLKGDSLSWFPGVVYAKGAVVEKDGVLYISTDGNNVGNDPEEPNTSYWIVASGSGGGSNEPHPAVYRVIGDGNTVYDVNHGYDTLDVLHTAREVATGKFLTYEAAAPQVGVLRLTFPTSLTADSVAVTITPARYEKTTYVQGAKHQLFTNATEVTVTHDFGHIPNVDVYDEIGMMMVGQVKVDEQKAIISFNKPKSGKVVVR